MGQQHTESPFSFSSPENSSFGTWLQNDPHFFRLNRRDTPQVQRVIRLFGRRGVFTQSNPDLLTHDYRLAHTVRFIAETYKSPQEIFDLFGVNPRTVLTYSMMSQEPEAARHYADVQTALEEMRQRRQRRKEASQRKYGQSEPASDATLAELAKIPVRHNGRYPGP